MEHTSEEKVPVEGQKMLPPPKGKSVAGSEEGATAGGAGYEDGSTSLSDSEGDGEADVGDDGRSAVYEGGGREGPYKGCHRILATTELLQGMMEYVGGDDFLFVAGTSKEWRVCYTHLYPALTTTLVSVVSSVECLRWAASQGLELSEGVFRAATEHGDVEVWKALLAYDCPWNADICLTTLSNEKHGQSVLRWLRSGELPGKERCTWDDHICALAGMEGNVEMLKWLLSDEVQAPFTHDSWNFVCKGGHIPAMGYVLHHPRTRALIEGNENGMWREGAFYCAENGSLRPLQFLHAAARHLCLWDADVCYNAVLNGMSLAVLKWLRSEEVQCPWDPRSCPQFLRDIGFLRGSDTKALEIEQWVHANGFPCLCWI